MQKRFLLGGVGALIVTAGFVVACGDDDGDAATNTTPDSGSPTGDSQAPNNGNDGGTPPGDAASDATSPPPSVPLVPKTSLDLPNAIDPYGLLFASDGLLYASGATIDGATRKLAVWRFNNGALDTTFGNGGVLTVDVPGDELSFDMVEVSSGNFVVQAVAGGKVYLVKLTKDSGGAFTFGTPTFVKFGYDDGEGWPTGTPNLPAGNPSYASWSIAVDKSVAATPKIVVFAAGAPAKAQDPANQRVFDDRWITRLTFDTLTIDPGFNGGSPFSVDADGKNLRDHARRGIVLADGSIVSSGYTPFSDINNVVLIKLKADGTPDTSFGFGVDDVSTSPAQTKFNPFSGSGGFAEAYGVVRQSSGRLVTTGYGTSNFDIASKAVDLVSFRVNPDGIDPTYGKLGSFVVQSETNPATGGDDAGIAPWDDRGRDLVVLPDDRLVFGGAYDARASIFVASKDGKLETNTGDAGALTYSWRQAFFKVAVSPDGKKVAATAKSLRPGNDAGAPLGTLLVTLSVGQ